ncbi:YehR family protein [Erysipelothrix sp. HDW6B]|uniref:DUF1307 domain-containing protein n=1 Tax=Erysipelothrix sp. HDW6B TaxID=2714929 RepID=UPI00140E8DA6|nr:DUF1307 domain-containing protein [Erysipelothrix sp. HDW6B]QIK86543.1 YehR family protein [Erysipelothrix sp. HDW6B]
MEITKKILGRSNEERKNLFNCIVGHCTLKLLCTSSKETIIVCSGEINGGKSKNTIVAQGNKVTQLTNENTVDMKEMLELAELPVDDLPLLMELIKSDYTSLEGVQYTSEINGESIVSDTTIIDFKKDSLKELYDADLIDTSDVDYLSVKETQK